MALVSVIMPAYNCAEFIAKSIESVKAQTFPDWELLIIDDCSSDNTVEIVSKFLSDSRILLFRNDLNSGGAATRNKAIEMAKGRYIAFLDADDIWLPNKLDMQLAFMKNNNIGFSFSGHTTMDDKDNLTGEVEVPKKVGYSNLLKHNYIGCLTVIYDTSFFGKFYMPLVRKRQDFALWLTMLKKFEYAYALQESLALYRIRSNSLSSNKIDAIKYYWIVLRDVGGCTPISASYYILCYLFIVFLKKKFRPVYHSVFID